MKKTALTFKRTAAAVAAVAMLFTAGSGAYASTDDITYDGDRDNDIIEFPDDLPKTERSLLNISCTDSIVDPDADGTLSFTVKNLSSDTVGISDPSDGRIAKFTNSGWEYTDAVYSDINDINGFDEYAPDNVFIAAGRSAGFDVDISDLDDGEYRLEFTSGGGFFIPDTNYVYFTVRRSVAFEVRADIYGYADLCVTNNSGSGITVYTDSSMLERYRAGSGWETVKPISGADKYALEDSYYIPSGESSALNIDLGAYYMLSGGKYRIVLDWESDDDYFADGSCSAAFTLSDPLDAECISTSVKKRSDMTLTLSLKNNTSEKVTLNGFGRIMKKHGKNWVYVNYKKRVSGLDTYISIRPGRSASYTIPLKNYYYTTQLPDGEYRAEIKLGSSVQYVYFKITSSGSYITVR